VGVISQLLADSQLLILLGGKLALPQYRGVFFLQERK
jgi:hypothetical protein